MDLLNPKLRNILDRQLFEVACSGFARDPSEEFRVDVANHLRDGYLYIAHENSKAVGFAVLKDYSRIDATYISGIVKEKTAPSGIVEEMVNFHIQRFGVVAVRTQNDRVIEIMRDICTEVVPVDREAGKAEFDVLHEMGLLNNNVLSNMVAVKHYGGEPMIGNGLRKRSLDQAVKQTTNRLNYMQGDALLLVGYRK